MNAGLLKKMNDFTEEQAEDFIDFVMETDDYVEWSTAADDDEEGSASFQDYIDELSSDDLEELVDNFLTQGEAE